MKKLAFISLLIISFSLSAQTPITTIPFEQFGDHILFRGTIDNSQPLDIIFDTGAGITVIDDHVAEDLHLVKHEVVLNEEMILGHLIKHNTIEINDFLMEKNINVYSTSLDHLEISLGINVDAIVGYDLLRHHDVRVNYDEKTMEIYESGKGPKTGDPVPIKLINAVPVVNGVVVLNNEEPHDASFFIMTGAGTTMDFNTPYSIKNDVIHKTGKHFSYFVKSISEIETLHYEGHVLSLSFGNQKLTDLPIGISQSMGGVQGIEEVSGIIGGQILSKYNLMFSHARKVIYFDPGKRIAEPLYANSSGIDIQLSKDLKRVLMHQIIENSPASEAGITLNARLLEVNGKKILEEVSMADVKKILRQEGETVSLLIYQNGGEEKITLKLRALIDHEKDK